MKRLLFTLILNSLFAYTVLSQDVRVQSAGLAQSPASGCALPPLSLVTININNNSSVFMTSNSITASYRIDGGPITSQLVGPILTMGSTITFSFSVQCNVSVCGPHQIKAWAKRPGDMNPTNDTLTWTIQNDCVIIPGTVSSSDTVCSTANTGLLSLTGNTNGSITSWQSSINAGSSWNTIPVTTSTLNYLNLTVNTLYRVQLEGGFCPDATSGFATILVETPPTPGTLSGPAILCSSAPSGSLNVTGISPIDHWEFSTDGGMIWSPIVNTSNTYNFTGLVSNTSFRVVYGSTACGIFYSNVHLVSIENAVTLADVNSSTSLCSLSAFGSLTAINVPTSINFWQSSTNGGSTWTTISSTTSFLVYSSLTQSTMYRFNLNGVACPASFSDTAIIIVQTPPILPTLGGGGTFCVSSVAGNVTGTGSTAPVLGWESSINSGSTWTSIPNTTYINSFTGVSQTTQYRVLIDGGLCPDVYSSVITVIIDPLVSAGALSGDDSLCFNNISGTITSSLPILGTAIWQNSLNGSTWSPISNSATSYDISSISQSTYYRIFMEGNACPDAFSNTVFIYVDNFDVGTIAILDSACGPQTNVSASWTGIGQVLDWNVSTDNGMSWTALGSTSNPFVFPSMNQTTLINATVSGYVCAGTTTPNANIYIENLSNPGILKTDTSVCFGNDISMELSGNVGDSIIWQSSTNGVDFTTISGNQLINAIQDLQETIYVQVIVQNGICPSLKSNIIELMVLPLPEITVGPDTTINEKDTVTITALTLFSGNWSPTTYMINPLSLISEVFPTTSTDYIFTVSDSFGCTNSDTATITVIPSEEFEISNVLTMNGDLFNEVWGIKGIQNFPNTKVKIFNLYGKQIYMNDNYDNSWDGTNNGNALPNGTYYYIVIQGITEKEYKGTMLLIGGE